MGIENIQIHIGDIYSYVNYLPNLSGIINSMSVTLRKIISEKDIIVVDDVFKDDSGAYVKGEPNIPKVSELHT